MKYEGREGGERRNPVEGGREGELGGCFFVCVCLYFYRKHAMRPYLYGVSWVNVPDADCVCVCVYVCVFEPPA